MKPILHQRLGRVPHQHVTVSKRTLARHSNQANVNLLETP